MHPPCRRVPAHYRPRLLSVADTPARTPILFPSLHRETRGEMAANRNVCLFWGKKGKNIKIKNNFVQSREPGKKREREGIRQKPHAHGAIRSTSFNVCASGKVHGADSRANVGDSGRGRESRAATGIEQKVTSDLRFPSHSRSVCQYVQQGHQEGRVRLAALPAESGQTGGRGASRSPGCRPARTGDEDAWA